MRRLAILTVKDEGAFVLEWLAFHRSIGFTDVLVFSNDCADGTDLMLDRLQEMGLLAHVPQAGPFPKGPQWAALNAAEGHPLKTAADWVMPLDIDEFVTIHLGDGSLDALLAAYPQATAFALTWRLFGNGGVIGYEDAPVTTQFTRAAPPGMVWPWRASMMKTLFRNDGSYARLGVHRPRQPDPARLDGQLWIGGTGAALPARYFRTGLYTQPSPEQYRIAQLNHYALGAMESYVVKCGRGRANRDASTFDMSYWVERNFDTVEDRSVAPAAARAAPLLAELRADPVLGPLHDRAVAWRHTRFKALMRDEPFRALFGRLLLTAPTWPMSPERLAIFLHHARRAAAETVAPPAGD
ncbi:glycosyltransferase family 2 protein [Frigidibacter albus]